ncbi:MAG: divalent-cation tolerance protein CutA [Candidatus Omnitrophica bacterium]|nr:divalent-cation tolerance protein CutA [Candidatus Omnitrophota bacterium]
MGSHLLILSTVPNLKEARSLASVLLEKKLAACVNISPGVESHYRWKGKKEKSREVMLFIKTREALFGKLEKTLRENHSYEVPEIIALPIQRGSKKYLNWLAKETKR